MINQILIHIHVSNMPLLLFLIVPQDFLSCFSLVFSGSRGGHDGIDRYNMCGQMQKSTFVGQMGEMLNLRKH